MLEEAEQAGLAKGEQIGLEKGIAIYQAWQSGVTAEEIAARFELTQEQVKELLRQLKRIAEAS